MILLGTPTYNNEVGTNFMASVFATIAQLGAKGLPVKAIQSQGTQISVQRNAIATAVYRDKQFSHVLFADSDISWQPSAPMKMLSADKPVIGCICPSRRFDPIRLMDAARREPDNKKAYAKGVTWFAPADADLSKPICQVSSIGTGLTMIKREVFERLAGHMGPDVLKGHAIPFFEQLPNMTEDVSFCLRWRQLCGGEIYAITDEVIGHTATFEIKAAPSDQF